MAELLSTKAVGSLDPRGSVPATDSLWRLHQAVEVLATATRPADVAFAVVSAALPAVGAQMGRLFLLNDEGDALESVAAVNLPEEFELQFQRVALAVRAPLTDAVRDGASVALTSRAAIADAYPEVASYLSAFGAEAVYVMPLRIGERRLGGLICIWTHPRNFGDQERAFIAALAGICAQALDRARLLEAERAARHRAERLQSLTAALSAALTIEQVVRVSLEEGMNALGARAGGVVLLTADGRHQELVSLGGVSEEAVSRQSWWRFSLDEPYPVNEVVRSQALLWMHDIEEFHARFPKVAPTVREAGYEAYVAAPLAFEGRVIGAINYNFVERRAFGDDDLAMVRAMAQQCAQALERARLFEAERVAHAEADVARASAEAANQVKGQFLATMSHELRTPLNAIAGYTELLELGVHGPITDAQRESLHRIQRSQAHLLSLINEVLNYARVEAGAVRYDFSPVGVMGALAAVESFILPQVRAKSLRLTVVPTDPSIVVRADAEKLSQVLLNLLSNAVKFTPAGGAITVEAQAHDTRVEISVNDTGPGIPPEQIDRVFEPFVQIGRMLNKPTEGTGLGLAISRDLARGMAGDLTASSIPGEGSTFILTLPRQERA